MQFFSFQSPFAFTYFNSWLSIVDKFILNNYIIHFIFYLLLFVLVNFPSQIRTSLFRRKRVDVNSSVHFETGCKR